MNWRNADGSRWQDPDKIRVTARFRRYVKTSKRPNAPIERGACFVCNRKGGPFVTIEFHHVDYSRPYLGCWVCTRHHRDVERCEAWLCPVPDEFLHDFEPLIAHRLRKHRWVEAMRQAAQRMTPAGERLHMGKGS